MSNILKNHAYVFIYGLSIVLISLLAFRSSFSLAFDGDSYLTLWRYLNEKATNPSFNAFAYFFTDYGPQDTFFYVLYKIFGLDNTQAFFASSFVLRLIAAFSFFPLVFTLTKDKTASWVAVLLYAISATGIETTNWVFNMPSYLATTFMNIFIYTYVQFRLFSKYKYYPFLILFFSLSIITQPIRMMFLPVVIFITEFLLFIKSKSIHNLKTSAFVMSSLGIILVTLFIFGDIGDSIGVAKETTERTAGTWISKVQTYFIGFSQIVNDKQYQHLLNPIAHIGANVVPYNLYPPSYSNPATTRQFLSRSLLYYLIFIASIILLTKSFSYKYSKKMLIVLFSGFVWAGLCLIIFSTMRYPPSLNTFLAPLVGGYLLISYFFIYICVNDSKIRFGLLIAVLILILSHIIPWVRNPNTMQITTDRYLILSTAGYTLLISIFFAISKNKNYFVLILFPLLIFQLSGTTKYLNKIQSFRDSKRTEMIRSSVPVIQTLSDSKTPTLVYFEKDSPEVLYHSLMFGFPVIMYFYQNAPYIWNIAYTESWKETYDAYITGESLRRFGTMDIAPLPLSHIYAFRLSGDTLIDITEEKRQQLQNETR